MTEPAPARRSITPRQILFGALVLLALIFVFVNGQDVEVDYILGSSTAPLWLVIILSGIVGGLIDRGLVVFGRRRGRK